MLLLAEEKEVRKEGKCREEKTMLENPHTYSAQKNNRNTLKSLKRIQKLPHILCFLLVFTWKNTLKSNKSTENSSGGSLNLAL